jgi:histidinol dehydrogenase
MLIALATSAEWQLRCGSGAGPCGARAVRRLLHAHAARAALAALRAPNLVLQGAFAGGPAPFHRSRACTNDSRPYRHPTRPPAQNPQVEPIVGDVRKDGDAAVKRFTAKFDRVELDKVCIPIEVSEVITCRPVVGVRRGRREHSSLAPSAARAAASRDGDSTPLTAPTPHPPLPRPQDLPAPRLPEEVTAAFDVAYNNIAAFHRAQRGADLSVETMPGVVCRRVTRPIGAVGIYVPGGTAVLPSSALMLAVPAQIAGCGTVVLATPPRPDGSITPEVLYCAKKAGVTHVLKAGGAQAVAAMGWGTESTPKVDKIFGPGNQYVTAAKMLLTNSEAMVSIDMPAGPSEVLVIADAGAPPAHVAADLLSQAEHGPDSQVVLLALPGVDLDAVQMEVGRQCDALPRSETARKALAHSCVVQVGEGFGALSLSWVGWGARGRGPAAPSALWRRQSAVDPSRLPRAVRLSPPKPTRTQHPQPKPNRAGQRQGRGVPHLQRLRPRALDHQRRGRRELAPHPRQRRLHLHGAVDARVGG